MKKSHILAAILAAALVSAAASAVLTANHTYSRTYIITEVSETILSARTASGQPVQILAPAEDWMSGDLCTVTAFDSFTADPADDLILHIRYSGTPAMFAATR